MQIYIIFQELYLRINNIIKQDQQMAVASAFFSNAACILFGILFVSISGIVMSQIYYTQQIESQIQTISQLTDIKYPSWGLQPSPSNSIYTQTIQLYNLQLNGTHINSSRSNLSTTFDFSYQYLNTSFQQGNSGRLDFINKWQLTEKPSASANGAITTLNLGADKIYSYDFYAPPQRKITILYNSLLNVLTSEFLQLFYATYLYEYFFKEEQLVLDTVFKPLKFDDKRAKSIYEDDTLGWNSAEKLRKWAVLSLRGQQFAKSTPFYEKLMVDMELTSQEISKLVFEKSTLYNMISALNGTIVTKAMQSRYFGYKCDKFCTNEELAAFQISSAFLTKDPLFSSLGLNMTSKQFNATFFEDIEYTTFCDNNPQITCMPDSTKAAFFTQHHFGNFQMVNLLWKNQNRIEQIENIFQLPEGTGESLVEYTKFLYGKYIQQNDKLIAWGQTNHNNLFSSVNKYYQLLMVELFSRGFYNKFLSGPQKSSCADYFINQTSTEICQKGSGWNLDEGLGIVRKYFQAYFFFSNLREQFKNMTEFSDEDVIDFFHGTNSANSLFSQQILQLQQIYAGSFQCKEGSNNVSCTMQQLFCMQWGSGKIFANLPTDIFPDKSENILQWDDEGILNNFNPDYFAITGEKVSVDRCQQILSSKGEEGIYSWFNVVSLASANKNTKLLKYIASNVVYVNMEGLLLKKQSSELLNGFNSTLIDGKKKMEVESGGAPWMDRLITLVKTNNEAQIKNNELLETPQFDTINTGIYDSEKTREISHIWGESKSSSKYVVYKGTKTDDEGKEVEVDIFEKYVTDRTISGTNLFGFHPNVEEGEALQIYLTQAYQPFTLVFDKIETSYANKDITVYRYRISDKGQSQSFIGIEELNQNYFRLNSDSYFLIEPFSGITLEFQLSYSIKTNPLLAQFLLSDSQESINLYDSKITFKKTQVNEFLEISQLSDSKHQFMVAGVIVAGICLLSGVILAVVGKKREAAVEKDTLLGSNTPEE